jgi:hypothetical protein
MQTRVFIQIQLETASERASEFIMNNFHTTNESLSESLLGTMHPEQKLAALRARPVQGIGFRV